MSRSRLPRDIHKRPAEADLMRLAAAYERLVTQAMGIRPSSCRDEARILWAVAHGATYRQAEQGLGKAESRRGGSSV